MKFNNPPAWGFGTSRKFEAEKSDALYNPGPGNYTLPSTKEGPTWRIGSALRILKNRNTNPGPGQYNIPSKIFNGPKYSMAIKLSSLKQTRSSNVPGPGQYEINTKNRLSSAKYTMRSKSYIKKRNETPGPGCYNLRKEKIIVPSYKFGSEKKMGFGNKNSRYVPGPGNYEYNADILYERNPKFSFGKGLRRNLSTFETPGPGQYEYKKFIGNEGPRITMSAKWFPSQNRRDKLNLPGPGQYNSINTDSYRNRLPAYRIGTAQRRGLNNSVNFPGPGQYGPDNSTSEIRPNTPAWKIGTGLRQELSSSDRTIPGVGNYNISNGLGDGPKYSMLGKGNTFSIRNGNPGPGQYNDTFGIIKKKNPSWKIGTSKRDDELKRIRREGIPGPGMYEFDDKTKNKAPVYGFGREKRGERKKNDTPGPGQYRIPCAFDDITEHNRGQGNFNNNFKYM